MVRTMVKLPREFVTITVYNNRRGEAREIAFGNNNFRTVRPAFDGFRCLPTEGYGTDDGKSAAPTRPISA
jgi:hypothetical protein